MDSYEVFERANRLIRHHGTNDPETLARELGIWIYHFSEPTELLGMYTYQWKHRMIFMNPNISDELYRMVLAHEIGHDQRHRALAGVTAMQDFAMFSAPDAANITEYEANAFAAHLLIGEDEMTSLFRSGYDLDGAASMLNVNPNLLLIKLREMNRMGRRFRLPFDPDAKFLKHTAY